MHRTCDFGLSAVGGIAEIVVAERRRVFGFLSVINELFKGG